MLQIASDWSAKFDVVAFERELGVKFKGPGLYCSTQDTLLVVPLPPGPNVDKSTVWNQRQPEGTVYEVHVWNSPISELWFGQSSLPPSRDVVVINDRKRKGVGQHRAKGRVT